MRHADLPVSVIIPTYNSNDTLIACLKGLSRQDYPASDFEVIVVDNGSDPPVSVECEYPFKLRLTVECRPGSYAARNSGVSLAEGAIIAFIDADCVPSRSWISAGLEYMDKNESVDVIGGRVDLTFKDHVRPRLCELYDAVTDGFSQKQYIEKSKFAIVGNLMARRKVFDSVGLFNAALKSGGDGEWTKRAHDGGHPLEYCENMVVEHGARSTLGKIINQRRRIAGGHVNLGDKPIFPIKLAYAKVKAPYRLWKKISPNEKLDIKEKIGLIGIQIAVSVSEIAEIILVSLGKDTVR